MPPVPGPHCGDTNRGHGGIRLGGQERVQACCEEGVGPFGVGSSDPGSQPESVPEARNQLAGID